MLYFEKRLRKGDSVKTMSVRLPDETYAELVRRAELVAVPPAVLARAFLKESVGGGVNGFSASLRDAERGTEQFRASKKRGKGRR